jgi:predicted amidohydrolase|uniref:Acyltransferase n=1 Tax=candidate division WOR-3 bacterium TaxID=2052148 RepID=A0A7C3UXI1_UNCW3
MKIKVGYLQFSPVFGAKDLNLKKVGERLSRIRRKRIPSIICLPELFATGYSFLDKKELSVFAEEIPGKTQEFLQKIACQKNLLIAGGIAEREGDRFFNSAILCLPDGSYYVYRKVHLFFREKELFTPGDTPFSVVKFSSGGFSLLLGLLICFDYIFPEAARTLALKGAQIILHPSNLILPYAPKVTISRAIENRVYWVLANRTGIEKRDGERLKFFGNSQVVSPEGKILRKAGKREEMALVEIEPDEANVKQVTPTNNLFSDRRPDLYFK